MANPSLKETTSGLELMPVRSKDSTVPTRPWTSSHDEETVRRYLCAMREWACLDWAQVYDDLDTILHGEQEMSHHAAGPSGGTPLRICEDSEGLDERFRRALKLLVARALREEADEKHPDIASLIELARTLRAEDLPADPWQAIGPLRKLARVTLALAERLDDIGVVKGLVEC
ncbi:DUF6415 family natural product biosynthesis protein [Streptomyces violascens]|uniref:DUF6415 family natural product biosynthesis protein n=1 Tax=Streptomyces violascens TaxID=67381 RepID=UPI0036CD14F1